MAGGKRGLVALKTPFFCKTTQTLTPKIWLAGIWKFKHAGCQICPAVCMPPTDPCAVWAACHLHYLQCAGMHNSEQQPNAKLGSIFLSFGHSPSFSG